jgi:hypothetical protein
MLPTQVHHDVQLAAVLADAIVEKFVFVAAAHTPILFVARCGIGQASYRCSLELHLCEHEHSCVCVCEWCWQLYFFVAFFKRCSVVQIP